jgi:hypothetical protein
MKRGAVSIKKGRKQKETFENMYCVIGVIGAMCANEAIKRLMVGWYDFQLL